ncbi:hypothetical protein BDA99DRAFT_608542 [Phascolomyces articulosus]|uniref:Uncharacterized protein n=1 Tax=Phascolomyces articulosus TaxID=60185 RepID=A0AAD5JR00_9FUNG|nr:hypothetical protein BDA99DRAFT_608542 [Phascolomyces articulosus]
MQIIGIKYMSCKQKSRAAVELELYQATSSSFAKDLLEKVDETNKAPQTGTNDNNNAATSNPTAPTSISITNPSDSKDSNETRQQSAQQIVEEEGQEKEGQEDFPSDITEDYHPTRTADYHFMIDEAESEKVGAEALDGDDDNNNELDHWIIGDINISKRLTDARLSCLRVQSKKCRISDCSYIRRLAKYPKSHYPHFEQGHSKHNTIDLVVANVLHQQSLEYTGNASQSPFEDTYVHRSIAALFKSVFQSDPLFSYDWANGALCAKRKMGSEAANAIQKPDFVAFVSSRKDLAVAEIKPPSNNASTNHGESDQVKLGKMMRSMYNALIQSKVSNPIVGGILVEGKVMRTFIMKLQYRETYELIQLAKSDLYHDIKSLSNLPMLIQDLLWLKNILKPTAVRVLQVESQKRTATPTATPNPFSPPKKYLDMDERTLLRSNKKQKKSSSD